MLFASAAVHALFDLLVHREDGHRHLWPLSDWRFMSPVSYWDPEYGGALGSLLEVVLVAAASVVLWRRHPQRPVRGVLLVFNGASLLGWLRFYAGGLF